jgi:hypothetical protein
LKVHLHQSKSQKAVENKVFLTFLLMEGTESVQIMTDQDPGGPKTLYKIAVNRSIPEAIVGLVPVVTLWAFSRGSAPLMRIPLVAPTPVPTMTAVGVARPSEHGHAAAGKPIHPFSFQTKFSFAQKPVQSDSCCWTIKNK